MAYELTNPKSVTGISRDGLFALLLIYYYFLILKGRKGGGGTDTPAPPLCKFLN